MKLFRLISFMLILFFTSAVFAEEAVHRYSLDEMITLALEQNYLIKARRTEFGGSYYKLEEASANFWPILEYQYRIAPVPTDASDAFNKFFEGQDTLFNSFKVLIALPITTFGKIMTAKEMARQGMEAAHQKIYKEERDVVFQVKSLYYGILLAKEIEKLLGDAIEKINKKIKDNEEAEVSDVSPFEMAKLKMFLYNLEKRLAETREQGMLATEGLKFQIGLPEEESLFLKSGNLALADDSAIPKKEECVNKVKDKHPEVKMIDVGVDVKKKMFKLEKFKMLPDAGFGFYTEVGRTTGRITGLQATDDFNNPFNFTRAGVGLQISGKLDIHGAMARIRHAEAEYFKSSLEAMAAKRGISIRFEKSYNRYLRAKQDVGRADKSQTLARQMLFLSKMNEDLGLTENKDYQDSLQAVLLTRGEYYRAVFDFNVSVADLEKEIGI